MNQLKSNLAISPARLARLVTRISSPVHCAANTDKGSIVGRPAESPPGSWNSTRCPSHCASSTVRMDPSSPRSKASAGSGARVRRSAVLRLRLALSQRCLAASNTSSTCARWPDGMLS